VEAALGDEGDGDDGEADGGQHPGGRVREGRLLRLRLPWPGSCSAATEPSHGLEAPSGVKGSGGRTTLGGTARKESSVACPARPPPVGDGERAHVADGSTGL
jgi:hypothetical protein